MLENVTDEADKPPRWNLDDDKDFPSSTLLPFSPRDAHDQARDGDTV
jgi:hypothetical protein